MGRGITLTIVQHYNKIAWLSKDFLSWGLILTPYIQHINWDLFEQDEYDEASLKGSVNVGLIKKRKRALDEEDGPEAKRIWWGYFLAADKEWRRIYDI